MSDYKNDMGQIPSNDLVPRSNDAESDFSGNDQFHRDTESRFTDLSVPLDPSRFPHVKKLKNGGYSLLGTIYNVHHMLNEYGIEIYYDVTQKEVEIRIPTLIGVVDNAENVRLELIISLANLNGVPNGQISNFVSAIAEFNPVNTVENWIRSKPWDGKNRLPQVCNTLVTNDDFPQSLKETLIIKWLTSAVAAATSVTGFHARGVLTIQGPQGVGKTTWIRKLVSDPTLTDAVVLTGHHLDPGNKDSLTTAIKHWIVEIGELDSSFKKDVARLKGFLTNPKDKVRRPYARTDSVYQRRTVFCATVNEQNFLVDKTGNTRFWTLPVVSIDYQHDIDMQQVFAQLLDALHTCDATWWLSPEEEALLATHNRAHKAVSVIEERLLDALDTEMDPSKAKYHSATETLEDIGFSKPSNQQCRECGGLLRELYGNPKKINGIYKWRVPLKRKFGF